MRSGDPHRQIIMRCDKGQEPKNHEMLTGLTGNDMIDLSIDERSLSKRGCMDHIMTVRDVIEQLQGYDPDLPVMIGVCKYPEEMPTHNWLDHETSEVIAVEQDDISIHDNGGVIIFGCELADYSKERHFAGG